MKTRRMVSTTFATLAITACLAHPAELAAQDASILDRVLGWLRPEQPELRQLRFEQCSGECQRTHDEGLQFCAGGRRANVAPIAPDGVAEQPVSCRRVLRQQYQACTAACPAK